MDKPSLTVKIDEIPEGNLEVVYSYLIKAAKRSPMRTLHNLLKEITEENRHKEQITDRQGKELI
jgi:antitoxin component of MazEF toxin-antitoxin module